MVKKKKQFLSKVLLVNGIVDVFCAAILIVLPMIRRPLLGYQVFDTQGAFMAGGWGVATLALAVGRIWASSRFTFHPVMLLMGVCEATTLAVFSLLHLVFAHVSFMQVLLPLSVGVVFGTLYWMCALRRD